MLFMLAVMVDGGAGACQKHRAPPTRSPAKRGQLSFDSD
jgi:hypothetical protein